MHPEKRLALASCDKSLHEENPVVAHGCQGDVVQHGRKYGRAEQPVARSSRSLSLLVHIWEHQKPTRQQAGPGCNSSQPILKHPSSSSWIPHPKGATVSQTAPPARDQVFKWLTT
ncbi:hypothetical protein I79_002202 [Cricetulus griseus]|uniref:Uncharacterized protein n=1 Tax=Cricetulus griseus TaxID=10029 RepID=G3GWS1_CRIGR|nr:hypothetical protein I79_002202 [Cricetulus griseus]ERE70654.1 hypothetical protein H671_6g16243 [Cricetulus griseus]